MWPDCSPPRLYPPLIISSTNVAVADLCPYEFDAEACQVFFESEVAHYSCNHTITLQPPFAHHLRGAYAHYKVAVYSAAFIVDKECPVCVAVMSDADMRAVSLTRCASWSRCSDPQ